MPDQNQPPADNNQAQGDNQDNKVVQIGKYKVKVDRNLCIGAASCVAVAANVFELDDKNIAVIKEGAQDTEENLLLAAQSCPTNAIIIVDESGKQIWPE